MSLYKESPLLDRILYNIVYWLSKKRPHFAYLWRFSIAVEKAEGIKQPIVIKNESSNQ